MKLQHIIPLLVLSGHFITSAQTNNTAAQPNGIKFDENTGLPIGALGGPLGIYMTIEGAEAKRDRQSLAPNLFRVDTVNGRSLAQPVCIELENARDWLGGGRSVFKGYESMEMIGIPPAEEEAAKEAGQKGVMPPQMEWQLRRYFVVTSVAAPSPSNDESFQQERRDRMTQAKQWALAFIMFADDNGNQLPKNFEQATNYVPGLSKSNWEIMSGGDFSQIAKPSQTILLREKESRRSPDGPFLKAYAFMDGHAELISSLDGDFAALEKQRGLLAQPARQ
jgi:hypothetical protein